MTAGELAAVLVLLGVFIPGAWMACRGQPHARLVGLEFASIGATIAVMLIAVGWQRDLDLIVALALAVVTLPGTLVFTRLLAGKS
ncbi:hypothetical protein A5707_06395 [Mycobacterium kyorinense]|uniref:Cation:proton antiporter n=1 Tax=Mycobacterium kyorinense TaxID=487514 RepID=A0A1A2YZ99_9MYCO|nr:hypothetical protein [Mycobacterium kyorinense]OBI42246.1 hypothetical protein A5707_06395 [Mycobacterium kyorinense]